jgi:hypothetical protein
VADPSAPSEFRQSPAVEMAAILLTLATEQQD